MKRTAIISGGTKGLGRELTLAFGRAGYTVMALYSADETAAQALQVALAEAKLAGTVCRHDVCSEETNLWNRPEIQEAEHLTLINNACAAFSPMPMHQLGWQDFEKNFLVAVKGAWSCSQPLIRRMIKNGRGTIVNVLTSAVEGQTPKGFAAYLTAKHALRGFTLALAAEYAARGVKIFSVSPGYMETPLTQHWDHRWQETIRTAGRVTLPTEAAARLVRLAESSDVPGGGENYPL
jgi:NAD(P)-dependent dehydrogenase (short-subunit alcohol dehydrogenase family)